MGAAQQEQSPLGFSVTVKVPQIQFIAESEDIPVVQQRRCMHSSNCAAGCVGADMAVGAAMKGGFRPFWPFFALLQVVWS